MRKNIIILISIIGLALAVLLMVLANRRTIEAKVIDTKDNVVTFEDVTNNLWEYETSDYKIDDVVILTFNDKGTDFLEDDEIVKIRKVGE